VNGSATTTTDNWQEAAAHGDTPAAWPRFAGPACESAKLNSCKDESKAKGGASAVTQIWIVGFLAFCGPGLFNALNGLGNAGSSNALVAAMANGSLYITFAITSCFAGAAFNLAGPIPLFVLGGASYAAYAICIFFADRAAALAILGGVILGVGAGLFWTAQGSLMMAYATPQSRGRLIATFWMIFNLGGVLGGFLAFGLNFHNESGTANHTSYFCFIGVMLMGAAAAPFMLAHPSRVLREDGSQVVLEQGSSPMEELRSAMSAFSDPFIQCNVMFYFASNWFYTYEFSGFNGAQFNVRTRGLNSSLFWAAQMMAAWRFGMVLDAPHSALTRAKTGMAIVLSSVIVSLGLAIAINLLGHCPDGHRWDKHMSCFLDFATNSPHSLVPMFVFALLGAADAVYQSYAYWLMSTVAGTDVRKMVGYAALYKGCQSFGAGLAWLSDMSPAFSYRAQGVVALMLASCACLPVCRSFRFIEGACAPGNICDKGDYSTIA